MHPVHGTDAYIPNHWSDLVSNFSLPVSLFFGCLVFVAWCLTDPEDQQSALQIPRFSTSFFEVFRHRKDERISLLPTNQSDGNHNQASSDWCPVPSHERATLSTPPPPLACRPGTVLYVLADRDPPFSPSTSPAQPRQLIQHQPRSSPPQLFLSLIHSRATATSGC